MVFGSVASGKCFSHEEPSNINPWLDARDTVSFLPISTSTIYRDIQVWASRKHRLEILISKTIRDKFMLFRSYPNCGILSKLTRLTERIVWVERKPPFLGTLASDLVTSSDWPILSHKSEHVFSSLNRPMIYRVLNFQCALMFIISLWCV